jgi:hypothetical protein
MLIHDDEREWAEASPEDNASAMKAIFGWFEKWGSSGKIADGGGQLQPTQTAKTVRADRSGAAVITDGPYLELKEVLGGVVFLEADSLDDAVSFAATWPVLRHSTSLEVRPVVVN